MTYLRSKLNSCLYMCLLGYRKKKRFMEFFFLLIYIIRIRKCWVVWAMLKRVVHSIDLARNSSKSHWIISKRTLRKELQLLFCTKFALIYHWIKILQHACRFLRTQRSMHQKAKSLSNHFAMQPKNFTNGSNHVYRSSMTHRSINRSGIKLSSAFPKIYIQLDT